MTNSRNNSNEKSFNFFLPIAFILSIVPLIVRLAVVKLDENVIKIWGTTVKTDLFSQRKALLLIIFSVILIITCVIFFKKIFSRKDKLVNYILIACGVFTLFTFLSAIFSKYRQVSFWGIFDRAEGFITIACYMVLFLYSLYTFRTTNNYKYIITPLLILVFINAFLGLFQYIGQDLIKTSLGASIAGAGSNSGIDLLNEKGTIYGTLASYNYMGSFVAITLPILFCYTIFEDEVMYKILSFIGTLLSFWLLFGSTARSGIVGVLGALIFGIIIFYKPLIKRWKVLLIGVVTLIILIIGANFASKGSLFKRIPSLASDAFSIFKDTSDFDYTNYTPVKDIKYIDSTTEVVLPNDTLKITYENGNPVFKNSNGEVVPYALNGKVLSTNIEAFKNITFAFGKLDKKSVISDSLLLNINNQPIFLFKLNDNKVFHLIDMSTKNYIDLQTPETFGFKGKEKLGSSRGYIWSRSLPLIKNTMILGTGPDTFVFDFPQGDLIGKYYAYDTPNIVVDKAHNLYLQIAINYGVIALVGFIAMLLIYIIDSIKLYALKNNFEDRNQALGAITCLGIIGYLFAGIFNDSVVGVAPIFWIIFGVGIAINFMNRETLRKKSNK
ncbi:O-antigen ligase family protein [Clostridium beijerinckii]|uniref:O-antigen ligase family protein n=1 Tax=Clostridium beijerinckii TaxID=1520 RepID=UPI0013613812|nr:O-antigen ligase family protein [Clostridium beijerinckii]MZK53455.1 O-antigen ligase domain-containing protein [Clostridium beijerinckii]MZK61593.1 O-antigen ligase domain-containing protein [Clostridium beijerinckii]MZK71879.1 O-antigen ligase domain-containing protein [Clostridium beijerinckii]MZK77222.1 O-antigen ligase domain-containing protein [Clostridium beijerinckii]MZK86850.1 O-antigen ligase domain-containing protein [Clostridium beijerinckii]